MQTLLRQLCDHLLAEGFPGEVGRKPDDADDARPYFVVMQASTQIDGSIGTPDSERDPQIQVKCIGSTADQAGGLHERLDVRAKSLPGVLSVAVENETGPHRNDDAFPGPEAFDSNLYLRIQTSR